MRSGSEPKCCQCTVGLRQWGDRLLARRYSFGCCCWRRRQTPTTFAGIGGNVCAWSCWEWMRREGGKIEGGGEKGKEEDDDESQLGLTSWRLHLAEGECEVDVHDVHEVKVDERDKVLLVVVLVVVAVLVDCANNEAEVIVIAEGCPGKHWPTAWRAVNNAVLLMATDSSALSSSMVPLDEWTAAMAGWCAADETLSGAAVNRPGGKCCCWCCCSDDVDKAVFCWSSEEGDIVDGGSAYYCLTVIRLDGVVSLTRLVRSRWQRCVWESGDTNK